MLKAVKHYFTTTKINSICFTHKWTLDNFSFLYSEDHSWKWEICSDKFSPPNNELFEFELYLHPKGNDETLQETSVPLIGVCANDMPRMYEGKVRCRWSVWIQDENDDKRIIWGLEEYCLFGNQGGILPDLIQYSKLLDLESQYLVSSKLILYLEIHLQTDEPIFNVITNKSAGESRFDCANKVTRVEHTWTVENFAVDDVDANEEMVMPFFIQSDHFPEQSKHLFCLRLYPNGWSEESQDWVDIVFWNDNEHSNVTVHLRLSILDSDGEKCFIQEGTNKIDSKNGRIFRYLRASLMKNSNGLVQDNKLRIHCEMSYIMDGKTQDRSQISVHKSESRTDITQKEVHFVSYQWTIDKFSSFNSNLVENHFKDSEIFESSNFRFHLRLWPNGHDEHSKDYSYLSLDLFNLSQDKVTIQYRIFLCATSGYKWRLCCDQSTISKGDRVRINKFLLRSYFREPAIIQKYLQNDKLNLLCQICVLEDRKLDKTNIIIDKPIEQDTEASVNKTPPTHLKKINFHGSYHNFNSKIIEREVASKY